MINARLTARIVGTLMLAAFLLYGIGNSIATTAAPGPLAHRARLPFVISNGVADFLIDAVSVDGNGRGGP